MINTYLDTYEKKVAQSARKTVGSKNGNKHQEAVSTCVRIVVMRMRCAN